MGRVSHSFLVERLFVSDLHGNATVMFGEPRDLLDSTALTHANAAIMLAKTPRELGHRGLAVMFYCWDRAIMTACRSLLHKYNSAVADFLGDDMGEGERFRMRVLSWRRAQCVQMVCQLLC